jgi:lipopolysaccharide transport protein LptA
VKTVWVAARAARPAAGSGGDGAGAAPAGDPIEVGADEMRYREGAGTLEYRGAVRVEQGGKSLACRELEVRLDDAGRARAMTCSGAVRLTDRATGDAATGDRAVYDLGTRTVDITGAPVTLTKGDGGRIEGTRLVYDLDRGRARVTSRSPAAPPPPSDPPPAGVTVP